MDRNRSRFKPILTGTVRRNGNIHAQSNVYNDYELVSDVVAPGNGHRFHLDRYSYIGKYPLLNGSYQYAGDTIEYSDYPVQRVNDLDKLWPYNPIPGSPTDLQAAADIAAKTNPSRPLVDINVFIVELRELPDLLFKRSKDIGADIASGRLKLEYGYKPLINDLLGFLKFKEEFQNRCRELTKLRETGLRRKRIAFNGSLTLNDNESIPLWNGGLGISVNSRVTTIGTEKVSVFVKWMPDIVIPRHLGLPNDSVHQKAFLALLGVTPMVLDASTIWELIPFSWLADWCTNMGDLLAANRNSVGAHIQEILVMRHWIATQSISFYGDGNSSDLIRYSMVKPSTDKLNRKWENKQRAKVSLDFEAHMPFLNIRQVSILADVVRSQFNAKVRKR